MDGFGGILPGHWVYCVQVCLGWWNSCKDKRHSVLPPSLAGPGGTEDANWTISATIRQTWPGETLPGLWGQEAPPDLTCGRAGLILSLITRRKVASSSGNDATQLKLLICLLSIIFHRAGICSHVDKNSDREIVLTQIKNKKNKPGEWRGLGGPGWCGDWWGINTRSEVRGRL